MRAVILAGGRGTRLLPYTNVLPKPLMPLGRVPILHVTLSQLRETGFQHITLAVGYMADVIRAYFGDGSKYGLKIDYSEEQQPLGTIGALSQIDDLPDNFLVLNGDVLTDLSFAEFFAYHVQGDACATIATYAKCVQIEYGVTHFNERNEIVRIEEKPQVHYQVSMGVYAFQARVLAHIQRCSYVDFPDFVNRLVDRDEKVRRFAFNGYWKDIGCYADYEKAAEDFEKTKGQFLGRHVNVAHPPILNQSVTHNARHYLQNTAF